MNKKSRISTLKAKSPKKDVFCKIDKIDINSGYQQYTNNPEEIITYGTNHSYPEFLIFLYNNSPSHGSILESKRDYIISKGVTLKNNDPESEDILMVNPYESLHTFLNKIVLDYLIYGYYCVKVVPNVLGKPLSFYHEPAYRVATNEDKTKFKVKKSWSRSSVETEYDYYRPDGDNEASTIYWYEKYQPTVNLVYPNVSYQSVIIPILTEIAITKFNLNNISNQFSVATIITMFDGSNIDDEIKEEINNQFSEVYSGEMGRKFLLNLQNNDGKAPEINSITSGDWADAYLNVGTSVENSIMTGHSVISPALFGVKTPGQLSNTQELKTAYGIFQSTQGDNYRNDLIQSLNTLFGDFFGDKLKFNVSLELPGTIETVHDKLRYLTVDEIRISKGYEPLNAKTEDKIDEQNNQQS